VSRELGGARRSYIGYSMSLCDDEYVFSFVIKRRFGNKLATTLKI